MARRVDFSVVEAAVWDAVDRFHARDRALVVLKTVDGGENWGISQIGLSANLKAIFFSELNSGYCTGSNGIIIKTTNSGLNWINILNPSNMNAILESVFFINEDTGFVSGDQYLRTTNSGLNWELFSGSGRSIYFTDSYTGYRTGGRGQ